MVGVIADHNRTKWIDATRGIAILITILGHCIGILENPENRFILSFHMPLFFFLSGLCAKTKGGFAAYFGHKVKTILFPQIVFGFLECAVDFMRDPSERVGVVHNFFSWFLVVLFYVSVLFYWLHKIGFEKNRTIRLVVYAVLMILIVLMDEWKIQTVVHLETVPMAMLFFLLGVCCRSFKADEFVCFHEGWILLIPVVVCCSFWNEPVAMYLNHYGNLLLFFIGAFCGIWIACNVGRCMQDNAILIWFGQNSIYCFVLHFTLIKGLHFVGKHLFPKLALINYQYPIYWCYFLACVCILMMVVPVCDFWFAPIFGKQKKFGKFFSIISKVKRK